MAAGSDVWAGARPGKPAVHKAPFVTEYVTYDDNGNIFAAGYPGGSDPWLVLGELPKGARELEHIKLDKRTGAPGSIAWDGTRVAVGTGGFVLKGAPRIYRVKISGTSGRVTGETVPRDRTCTFCRSFRCSRAASFRLRAPPEIALTCGHIPAVERARSTSASSSGSKG